MLQLGTVRHTTTFGNGEAFTSSASRYALGWNAWGDFVFWRGFKCYTLYRKVGGLHFFRIGRLGMSFYVAKAEAGS